MDGKDSMDGMDGILLYTNNLSFEPDTKAQPSINQSPN